MIRGRNARRAAIVEQLLKKEAAEVNVSRKLLKFLYAGKNQVNDQRNFEVSLFLSSTPHRSAAAFPSLVNGAW